MSKGQKLADLLNQNIRRDSVRLGPDLRTAIPRVAEMMYDNPLVNAAISLTPVVGDFQAAGETANSIRKGDTLGALLNGVGMLPFVPALGGMFIGKGAKTWDAIAHEKALNMAKAGEDPRKIWAETGNWKGPDGNWRQEIPDNSAVLDAPTKKDFSGIPTSRTETNKFVRFIPEHEAYDAYPKLQFIDTEAAITPITGGNYMPSINGGREFIHAAGYNENDLKKTLIHEMQHAIQNREGFARGGTPLESERNGLDPLAAYWNNAGEAEARATQARMNMDMAQRLKTFPADSYDVPLDQLIFRYGDGKNMSAGMLDAAKQGTPTVSLSDLVRPKTEFEIRHEVAQRNAALPVEQGGLGLPPNNTAMDRAKAMGGQFDYMHGTDKDFPAFRLDAPVERDGRLYGDGISVTKNVEDASFYGEDGQIMPLVTFGNYATHDATKGYLSPSKERALKKKGIDGVDVKDSGGVFERTVFNPSNIRSRFAAFDPFRRNESDLLAGVAPWAIPGGLFGLMMLGNQERTD